MVATILAVAGWHGGPWFLLFPLFWIALLLGAWFLFRRREDRGRGGLRGGDPRRALRAR